MKPGDTNSPHLVYDDLGKDTTPDCDTARAIVRAILERRYGNVCPQDYVEMVVESFKDDPIQHRKPRYVKERAPTLIRASVPRNKRISLIINGRHGIHHVEERGYVESALRIDTILHELDTTELFERVPARHFFTGLWAGTYAPYWTALSQNGYSSPRKFTGQKLDGTGPYYDSARLYRTALWESQATLLVVLEVDPRAVLAS